MSCSSPREIRWLDAILLCWCCSLSSCFLTVFSHLLVEEEKIAKTETAREGQPTEFLTGRFRGRAAGQLALTCPFHESQLLSVSNLSPLHTSRMWLTSFWASSLFSFTKSLKVHLRRLESSQLIGIQHFPLGCFCGWSLYGTSLVSFSFFKAWLVEHSVLNGRREKRRADSKLKEKRSFFSPWGRVYINNELQETDKDEGKKGSSNVEEEE